MRLTELIRQLARELAACGGRVEIVGPTEDVEVTGVVTDSRRVTPGAVFSALAGEKSDGNDFVEDAASRGAAAVISERHPPLAAPLPQLVVPDARAAMRTVAWAVWGESVRRVRLVGVTGTNGKTTVAWLTGEMLRAGGLRTGIIGTLGRDLGGGPEPTGYTTPETAEILESLDAIARTGVPWAVLEISSHALALGRVDGLEFDLAVFTNLTQDHLDFHGSLEAYRDAKAILFERLPQDSAAVLNRGDATSRGYAARTEARVLWSGLTPDCDVRVEVVPGDEGGARGRRVVLHADDESAELTWHSAGRHNLENLASAAATAHAAGVELPDIARAAESFRGVPGRLEAVEAGQAFRVLVDYAHTPDGLEAVLASLRPETPGRLICVFGCGGDRDRTKRPLMGRIAERLADVVFVTSDNPRTEDPDAIIGEVLIGMKAPSRVQVEADRERAIHEAVAEAGEGDVVLIAGKGHETEQIIGHQGRPFDDREVARAALRRLPCCRSWRGNRRPGENAA